MAVYLFSYGTLRLESVQRAQFGRVLHGTADEILGWRREEVEITDPAVLAKSGERFHPIIVPGSTEDRVAGTVFELTDEELLAADLYEVDDYRRIEVQLASERDAWVYVARSDMRHTE